MKQLKNKHIIIFDGVCNLCNTAVKFILKHDSKKLFLFASFQSDAAKELLLQFPLKKNEIDSVLYIENGNIYSKSNAALKIAKHLESGFKWLYILIIIPKFIRDFVYNIIARNRYKWFGKKNSCMVPSENLNNRFL